MTAMQVVSLPFISEDAHIRITPSLLISIIDCIKALTRKDNHDASQDFRRICSRIPEFEGKYSYYKFPGQGQRDTPVANLETVLMIMQHVPGPMAQQYRECTAKMLCEYIAKDKSNLLNGLASEERVPVGNAQQEPVVSSPYMDMAAPPTGEYQQAIVQANMEVYKRNIQEMGDHVLGLQKQRITAAYKDFRNVDKEKAAAEKERHSAEKERYSAEKENYTIEKLQKIREQTRIKIENRKDEIELLKLDKEYHELRRQTEDENKSETLNGANTQGKQVKRGRPMVPTVPVVPVAPVGVMLSEDAVNRLRGKPPQVVGVPVSAPDSV